MTQQSVYLTAPATLENVETLRNQYAMDQDMKNPLIDDIVMHFDGEGYIGVEFEVDETTLEIEIEENSTIGDMYRSMVKELENYVDYESCDDSAALEYKDGLQQRLHSMSAILRKDADMAAVDMPKSFEQRIEQAFQNMYTPKSSGLKNAEYITEDTISRLIEDHDLSHGNFEYDEAEEEITVVIEAPNHTTFSVYHHTKEDGPTIGCFRQNLLTQIEEFDPNDEYDMLWSREFGEHNGFEADGFYVLLHAAQKFFNATANDMSKDFHNDMVKEFHKR